MIFIDRLKWLFGFDTKEFDIKETEEVGEKSEENIGGENIGGENIEDEECIKSPKEASELMGIDPGVKILGSITFSVLSNDDTHIYCQWAEDSLELALPYGEMLYKINAGIFGPEILSILFEHVQKAQNIKDIEDPKNPKDSENFQSIKNALMVGEIIECWGNVKEHIDNKPLISPSDVFAVDEQIPIQMPNNMEE